MKQKRDKKSFIKLCTIILAFHRVVELFILLSLKQTNKKKEIRCVEFLTVVSASEVHPIYTKFLSMQVPN